MEAAAASTARGLVDDFSSVHPYALATGKPEQPPSQAGAEAPAVPAAPRQKAPRRNLATAKKEARTAMVTWKDGSVVSITPPKLLLYGGGILPILFKNDPCSSPVPLGTTILATVTEHCDRAGTGKCQPVDTQHATCTSTFDGREWSEQKEQLACPWRTGNTAEKQVCIMLECTPPGGATVQVLWSTGQLVARVRVRSKKVRAGELDRALELTEVEHLHSLHLPVIDAPPATVVQDSGSAPATMTDVVLSAAADTVEQPGIPTLLPPGLLDIAPLPSPSSFLASDLLDLLPAAGHTAPAAHSGTLSLQAAKRSEPEQRLGNADEGPEWAVVYKLHEQSPSAGAFASKCVTMIHKSDVCFFRCSCAGALRARLLDEVVDIIRPHPFGQHAIGLRTHPALLKRSRILRRLIAPESPTMVVFRGGEDVDTDELVREAEALVPGLLEELRGALGRLTDPLREYGGQLSPEFRLGYYCACQFNPEDGQWRAGMLFEQCTVLYFRTLICDLKCISDDPENHAYGDIVWNRIEEALRGDCTYHSLLKRYCSRDLTEDDTRPYFRALLEELERRKLPAQHPATIAIMQICLFVLFSVFERMQQASLAKKRSRTAPPAT